MLEQARVAVCALNAEENADPYGVDGKQKRALKQTELQKGTTMSVQRQHLELFLKDDASS